MSCVPFNKLVFYPSNVSIPSCGIGNNVIFRRCMLANDSVINDATLLVQNHRESGAKKTKRMKRGRSNPFHELSSSGSLNANSQGVRRLLNGWCKHTNSGPYGLHQITQL